MRDKKTRRGAGLTIQPRKKVTVKKPQKQGPTWAVEPYDDDDDDKDGTY
jgi:hypothetical protein